MIDLNQFVRLIDLRPPGSYVNAETLENALVSEITRNNTLDARTGRSRPAIPIDCDQPLRLIATTDSGRSRPACGRR
jgi:hypothetical protein